ncbi:hypothetical protein [Brachyspira hampsonii]|uniref:hypothetical protein n=1 Tax=Brachyspira hampsonii TaxID=1287055 RepID=UPI002159D257|nr:hypothetical protein [Brachyspira hampsonii]
MLEYFPFCVHSIQIDNGIEFTYRKPLFEKENQIYFVRRSILGEFIVKSHPLGIME